MRLKKTIDLGDGRSAVVHEMQVQFVRNLLVNLKHDLAELSIDQLFGERFTDLVVLFEDLVELPDGETLDQLTFSELQTIWQAFKEVNAAFFDLTGMAAGLAWPRIDRPLSSNAAAADSSNADTSASVDMAGDST